MRGKGPPLNKSKACLAVSRFSALGCNNPSSSKPHLQRQRQQSHQNSLQYCDTVTVYTKFSKLKIVKSTYFNGQTNACCDESSLTAQYTDFAPYESYEKKKAQDKTSSYPLAVTVCFNLTPKQQHSNQSVRSQAGWLAACKGDRATCTCMHAPTFLMVG